MSAYILKRTLQIFPTLLGITILTFSIMHLAPGDPTDQQTAFNPKVSAHARETLKEIYGLDKPVHIQYINWIKRFISLDFGNSFIDGKPVTQKIVERLPITIIISILSIVLILLVSVPIGIISSVKQNSLFDKSTTLFVFIGFSIPSFWLALLLMILFGVNLGWLPISGYQSIDINTYTFSEKMVDWSKHLVLPVFVSAIGGLAGFSRYVRSEMLEVIRQDYIKTARAKGLKEKRVIYRHALKNALIPVITILGLSIPGLIGGSVIFETIFAIPGMGQLFYQSVVARDYPTVMGITVIGAILTLIGNFIADLCYSLVDPRVKLS